ncbi:hypothetical protein HYH02_012343 [Chlamydomonas schloesseri]|uniref:Cytochrome P450 n=1 Tax=Chlamydomonas schloesseri TaxID=2026947 RepID=A0A835W375_9CHLO|nr:hypothetical protein HYH02_012343 [Chlamydomonas schloesseri]|eukprot:KAG2434321.1 hypothetical protein HYH02_012343 [Chlamydomonas schloesseri]
MTFLFTPQHIDYFFGAPDSKITFRPAVEQFTQRVFGLTSRLFFPLHFKMLTELRHLLVPASIAEHMQGLGERALALLPLYVHHPQVDLYALCRGLVFHCAVEQLFGSAFMSAVAAGDLLLPPPAEGGSAGGRQGPGGGRGRSGAGGAGGGLGRVPRGRGERGASPSPAVTSMDESESEREAEQQRQRQEQQQQQGCGGSSSKWMPYPWLPQWAGALGAAGGAGGAGGGVGADAHVHHQRPPEGIHRLARDFFAFEDGFELAASPVPHALQPEFTGARRRLLALLAAADGRGLFAGTPAGQLLERTAGLPAALRPNLLLAVMWASQANTVPATFWAAGFLLLPENAHHRAAVLAELQTELRGGAPGGGSPGGGSAAYSNEELVAAAARVAASRRSAVGRCVAEALRLRVQSIDVRMAADDLELPQLPQLQRGEAAAGGKQGQGGSGGVLRLPRGRLLAVCPFVSHHDTQMYGGSGGGAAAASSGATGAAAAADVSSPWAFNPDRPELKLGDGTAVVSSVAGLAFGGGPYRCPGRFFAEQELGLLVQLLLWTYDMQLSYTADGRPAGLAGGGGGGGGAHMPAGAAAGEGAAGRGDRAAPPVSPGGTTTTTTTQQPQPDHHALSPSAAAAASRAAAAAALAAVPPQPQLRKVAGGSWLYGVLSGLVGARALAWGCGWFDGVDGPLEDFRHSGDPGGLLPPCDLKRLVGVKVPRRPLWVQLAVPHWQARRLGLLAPAAVTSRRWADID